MDTVAATREEQWCSQTEQAVTEFSSTLCHADAAELESAMVPMLERIARTVEVDRGALVEYGADGDALNSWTWADPAMPPGAEALDTDETPWLWERLRPERDALVLERIPADVPVHALTPTVLDYLRRIPLRSAAVLPARITDSLICALALETFSDTHPWPASVLERLRLFVALVSGTLHRLRQDALLRQSRADLKRLTARIEREQEPGDEAAATVPDFEGIIGESTALREALLRVQEVAPTSTSVLLLGETGTGKELFARAIHAHGPRRSHPLIVVNCA